MSDLSPDPRPQGKEIAGLDEPQRRRMSELPLVQLLPNLVTLASLSAGLTGLRFAFGGEMAVAAALIILAAILDGLDGRIARYMRSESKIGAELDSLCDFVNFGVVPGMTLYLWALNDLPRLGWIATLIYIACCALRLARFNLDSKLPALAHGAGDDSFVGVPSPAGALLALLPIFLANLFGWTSAPPTLPVAVWLLVCGFLMIGTFPTPSLKGRTIPRRHARLAVVAFVAVLAILSAYPWATLVALDLLYLALLAGVAFRGRRAV
jgi:CDP-diacylglycerol---serine O-phosphatidyltransferase